MKLVMRGGAKIGSEFGDEIQTWLDDARIDGKEFKVYEYYNNSLSAYVYKGKLYAAKITGLDGAYLCTINEFVDDVELRKYLLRYRNFLEIPQIDAIVLDMLEVI